MKEAHLQQLPLWAWLWPVLALVLGAGALATGAAPAWLLLLAAVLLGGAVFAAVHHAEIVALRAGQPLGSLLLAVAVTVIEVSLIATLMLAGAEGSEEVARDAVFSAVMIVLNGVIGLCLLLGGRRHHEQVFRLDAASGAMAVLGVLATFVLILPNYVPSGGEHRFSSLQLIAVAVVTFLLYVVFLFVQTVRHRDYFLPLAAAGKHAEPHAPPLPKVLRASAILLPLSLIAVIMLAKLLSFPLDSAVDAAGLPQSVVGVVIAAVVLTPEGLAATLSAIRNDLQNSINLVLGSALASIGLTIPVVTAIAIGTGRPLTLGLSAEHQVLLLLTLFTSLLTLGTGRTTILQGAVHLGIFVIFLVLSIVP